ncbi:MAG TPA: hypothetical protein VGI43_09105 [Mucilaginibacter sp.]
MNIIKLWFNKGTTLSNIVEIFTQTVTTIFPNPNVSTTHDGEHLHLHKRHCFVTIGVI